MKTTAVLISVAAIAASAAAVADEDARRSLRGSNPSIDLQRLEEEMHSLHMQGNPSLKDGPLLTWIPIFTGDHTHHP